MLAASIALLEAEKRRPSTIRAFSKEMQHVTQAHAALRQDVQNTLETEQITP